MRVNNNTYMVRVVVNLNINGLAKRLTSAIRSPTHLHNNRAAQWSGVHLPNSTQQVDHSSPLYFLFPTYPSGHPGGRIHLLRRYSFSLCFRIHSPRIHLAASLTLK